MLRELEILGLRGYADRAILRPASPRKELGSGLTVIVGPNNSGKSTLIEAFRLRRTYRTPSFHSGMRHPRCQAVSVKYRFDNHEEMIESVRPGSSEATFTGYNPGELIYFVPSRRGFSSHFGKSDSTTRRVFTEQYANNSQDRSPTMSAFEGRLFAIEKDQEAFNIELRRVFPDAPDWVIDQSDSGQHFLIFFSDHKSHSSSGAGEGVLSAFVIIAALYDSSPGELIVIDEPELSLHPQVQKRLARLIEFYAKDRQVILATHSPYFISESSIKNGGVVVRCWDRGDNIEIFHATSDDEKSGIRHLANQQNINNPHGFGLDAREVFSSMTASLYLRGRRTPSYGRGLILSHLVGHGRSTDGALAALREFGSY